MDFAIRQGVLGCEAIDLNGLFMNLPFGVHNYEATRQRRWKRKFIAIGAEFGRNGHDSGIAAFRMGNPLPLAKSMLPSHCQEHRMSRLFTLSLLVLVAAATNAADPAKEVESAMGVLNEAFSNQDVAVLRTLMAPDHVAITPFAGKQTLDEQLRTLPDLKYDTYSAGPMTATARGDGCVVLNYALKAQGTFRGVPIPSDCHVSAVWVRNDGRWQELLYQETEVVEGPETDEQLLDELTALERQSWEATLKGDKEFFKTFLAKEAKGMLADGAVIGYEQIIKNLDGLELRNYTMGIASILRVSKDSAMILYPASYEAVHKGTEERYSAVNCSALYERRNGRWQQLFYQETAAAKK